MIKKVSCLMIGLSLLFSVMCLSQPSLAQDEELSVIFINGYRVENVKGSKWLKEASSIEIKDINENTKIELEVNPDSALIKVIPSDAFPARVLVDNSPYEQLDIQLPYKIKKYRVELKMDDSSGKKFIVLHVKLGDRLKLATTDLLIVPIVYKVVIKLPFRLLFSKRSTIKIHKRV